MAAGIVVGSGLLQEATRRMTQCNRCRIVHDERYWKIGKAGQRRVHIVVTVDCSGCGCVCWWK